jgi:hypothetical protein
VRFTGHPEPDGMRRGTNLGASARGGFVCVLFAFSSLMHGAFAASGVMAAGALVLFGWAAWLELSRR